MVSNIIKITITFLVAGLSNATFINYAANRNCRTASELFSTISNSGKDQEASEVEKLLRRARELRAEADAAESQLHSSLLDKQTSDDARTDKIIAELFSGCEDNETTVPLLAKRIKEDKYSTVKLLKVVERLHERQLKARGIERVEPSRHSNAIQFHRISQPDDIELAEVGNKISTLLSSATLVDADFSKERGIPQHTVERDHWSKGKLASTLEDRLHFLDREHEDQFKNRLEEYYEAARKKKKKEDKKWSP
mmetsp:Transcript_19240/g.27062  ORF Transcript_19240/g.27062 Transcript_19240/m.27062 type:complete len:252 (-) Transcript_19240:192-947(-)